MSKRLGLLIVMMLFVSLMTGCFGSDDSSTTTTPTTAASVVITGSIPALSAPAGAPNYMVAYGTNYEMGVFNAATMTEITGSAVVINGTTYTATVPAGAANVTAVVVIKHKTTGKVVYSALAGILPTSTAMSTAAVSKVTVSGVNLNGESTALATIAKDKGIVAPSVPVTSTAVTTMPATVKSAIDSAVGTATLTAITNAVSAVQAVLNNSGVSEATKSSILSVIDAALANVLNAFVAAVKDASAVVNTTIGATTVSVGGQTIGATSTTTDVTSAVNGVTVVTITAVTNPADITVASGTAVTAITFPTTVSVTKSNGTTATASVVWSTTSTPAYVATTAGTYTFTGTVSGTTLTASVKVIVGAAQDTVATPTFTPAAGTYDAAQSVTIACATTGASIYYTTDGTTPTTASTAYTTAINVAATTTIKAIAVKTGMTNSAVASATYTVNISLIPVISAERAVKQANGDVVVTWTTNIVTPTAAKVIVRGSVPTPSDPSVTETVSTTTSHTATVTADKLAGAYDKLVISYIIGEDGTSKEILKAAIVDAASVVADPVITPAAGSYTGSQSVTITCATTGASIYYTVDGTTPTSASTLYTAAFNVTASATVKAIATATGMTASNVVSAAYVITPSTKVLTGITLAKATDTVEANVAYTLPTATAAYDDSTTGAATITWAEGATAVTSPVTKTTAGTYTFTATCTEGTVTKTATFTLVVTEAVPVKTLDSLTVTATPAAPTCLVGGTTSVALKVVANYLTGLVASTEEVTTFTTGTNWANGIFTAATTAAGTENIVVSFGGKTANVAVTVTLEAPKVTTVTVTLPTTIVEAATAQATVEVKDQFGAVMTTGFTTTYAITTGTSTSSTTGLVTAGSYSTTTGANAHVLTVTATPTTGTAVTATANFTVTADTTKPTIVSVSALDNKTLVVTYDKKVSSTATTITNYKLYHSTTGVTADMKTAVADQAKDIAATALFTDATNKVIKITISSIGTSLSGYPAGGLDAVNYRLYVSNVTDTTSNANMIIASSNSQFMGTTTPDSNKPVINAIAYNKGTGMMVVTLDKAVTNALVYSNIKFNGTVLTSAVTNNAQTTGEENKISVTVASADKTTIAALTGDITVTILVDAIADANGNKNVETSKVAAITVPPTMTSAVYDEATNILTMGFSQTLDLSTSTLRGLFTSGTNFQMKSTEFSAVALSSTDTLLTTSNNATVQVLLSNDHANAFEAVATHTSPKVLVAVNAFKNTTGDYNVKADDSTTEFPAPAMTVVKDTTKPAVTSVTYNETTKKLVFNFNVAVSKASADLVPANVLFFYDKDTKTAFATQTSLTGLTPIEVSDTTTLTYDLSAAGAATNLATDLKTAQQGPTALTTPTNYNSFVTFAADTFKKSGSLLKNVAVTDKATATTVTYTDNVAPALTGNITVTNQVTISFGFDEKVNKTDAETLANYKIYLGATSTELAVNSVKMTDYDTATNNYAQKTVQIVTGTQTSGQTYRLVVSNVKDLAGNVISSTDTIKYQKEFTGSATTAPAPKVLSAKIRDNGNQQLDTADYIAVTFDRPVKLNTSSTQTVNQNFLLSAGNGTEAFSASYNKSNVTMSTVTADLDCVVLIKADDGLVTGAGKITVGSSKIDFVTSGDLVKDKYSDVAAAAGVAVKIESPLGATTITEALLTDVDNSGTINKGDTLKVTFSNPLYVVSGTMAATNVEFETAGGTAFGTAGTPTISTTMTTAVGSNTLTVTFGDSPALLPPAIKTGEDINITNNFLKDSWGILVASSVVKTITTATVAAPYITKAEWVDVNGGGTGDSGDYVYVTFNVPVYISGNGTDGSGPGATNMFKIAGSSYAPTTLVTKVLSNSSQIRIQLTAGATLTPTVTTFELDPAVVASNITNVAGNAAVVATTINKISVPADTTAPTISSVEYIGDKKIKVVFSEAVNVSNLVGANITVEGASSIATSAAALDSADATGKTAIFTLASSVPIGEQTNGITGSLTAGLKIVAGNKVTDIAGNALAATATGANFISVSKDVTAPDYAALAYDLPAQITAAIFTHTNTLPLAGTTTGLANLGTGAGIAAGELALLEVYFGASLPAAGTAAAGTSASFANPIAGSGTLIPGLAAATVGHKMYLRLSDRVGNKSAWLDSKVTVVAAALPNATYKLADLAASLSEATESYYDSSAKTLTVYDAAGNKVYDIANNPTVQSICTNLTKNAAAASADSFVITGGLVSAISAAQISANATVTLTTADLAATVAVTGDAASMLTLAGTATGKTITLAAAAGYTVSATGASVVTVLGAVTTLNLSAAVTTININESVTNSTIAFSAATSQAVNVAAAKTLGFGTGTGITVSNVTQAHTIVVANTGIVAAGYPVVLGAGTGKTITAGTTTGITIGGTTPNATVAGTATAATTVNIAATTGNISF